MKALLLQVMQKIFIGGQSAGAFALAAVPLVQDEGEGAALPLLQEQLPAQLVVVFLLGADVEHDVGHRQQLHEFFAVGQVIAVDVRGVDEHFLLQGGVIVGDQLAMLQSGIEAVRLDRFVVVNHRIVGGWPGEGSLGNGAAGQGVKEGRL